MDKSAKKPSKLILLSSITIVSAISLSVFIGIQKNDSDASKVIFVDSSLEKVSLDKFSHIEEGRYASNDKLKLSIALKNDMPDMELVSLYSSDGDIYFASSDGRYFFDGNLIDTEKGYSVSDKELSRIKFSGERIPDSKPEQEGIATTKAPVIVESGNVKPKELVKSYESAIKDKIKSIKSPSRLQASDDNSSASSIQLTSSISDNGNTPDERTTLNQECLITFGGFNQPRIGYNDKCNRLSKDATQEQVKTLINGFPDEFFVRYEAEDEKSEIYVFTDYTCHYCQKLHDKIDGFLNNGISVNYIFYPRAIGIQGQDAMAEEVVTNMSSAWCSDNTVEATDLLYKRGNVPYASCKKNDSKLDSPVRQHYILGMMFEITGTPLIVGSNGNTTYGFRSVGVTLSRLGM